MPRLERALVIRKRDVEIQCDFQAEETTVVFAMDLTMTLGRLLGLALLWPSGPETLFNYEKGGADQ